MKTSSREHREAEFAELERKAREFLFKTNVACCPPPVDIGHPRFVTWHFPAFGDYHSWSVCTFRKRHDQPPQRLARQITWRRLSDVQRFTNPLTGLAEGFNRWPSIEVRDGFVHEEEVESRLEELTRIVIPVLPAERVMGTDRETFGFALEPEVRFEWWCEGPDAWKPLTGWTSETRDWLTKVCGKSTVQLPLPPTEAKSAPLPLP
jgi:hypothetical protein